MGYLQADITPTSRDFLDLSLALERLTALLLDTFVKGYLGAIAKAEFMDSAYAFFATQLMLQDMRAVRGSFDPSTGDFENFEPRDSGGSYHLRPGTNYTGGLEEFFEAYEWQRDNDGGLRGKKKKRGRGGKSPGRRESDISAIEKERDRLRALIEQILQLMREIFADRGL